MEMVDGLATIDSPLFTKLTKDCAKLQPVIKLASGERNPKVGVNYSASRIPIVSLTSMVREQDTCILVHVPSMTKTTMVVMAIPVGLVTTMPQSTLNTATAVLKVSARMLVSNSLSGDIKIWLGANSNAMLTQAATLISLPRVQDICTPVLVLFSMLTIVELMATLVGLATASKNRTITVISSSLLSSPWTGMSLTMKKEKEKKIFTYSDQLMICHKKIKIKSSC